MTRHRLLMIEDDLRLARMVVDYLGQADFEVVHVEDAASGQTQLAREPFDGILLDLMLPDGDGLSICQRIRAVPGPNAQTAILMLTAKGDPTDRVIGLEIGADDYLPKPFEPRELLARLRALMRRSQRGANGAQGGDVLRFGDLEINRSAFAVRVAGRDAALTSHQFSVLLALAERAGRVLSREQLIALTSTDVVGADDAAFDRSIDVHIARIRAAIEADPHHPKRLITVRGAGYVFAKDV